jgi:hypothetical protein
MQCCKVCYYLLFLFFPLMQCKHKFQV